ncbi:MAG: HAD family hydrolase [Deferrisomatales bacterium]
MNGHVVFLDLDGVVVRGQSQALLLRFALSRGLVPPLRGAALLLGIALGLPARGFAADRLHGQGARAVESFSEARLAAILESFWDACLSARLTDAGRGILRRHRALGDTVVLHSAAIEPLVALVARRLDIPQWFGTVLECCDSRYTGRVAGAPNRGREKVRRAAALLEAAGLPRARTTAYSDSHSDLPLLEWAAHPVAALPDWRLGREARRRGWPVIPR